MNVRKHPNQEGYIIEVDGREYASPPGDMYYEEADRTFNSPEAEEAAPDPIEG